MPLEVGLVKILTTTKFHSPVSKRLTSYPEIALMEFNFNTRMVNFHNIMGDIGEYNKLGEYQMETTSQELI